MRIISGKHKGTKLYTLDGLDTRPTLDRVKEPLFSIINFDIPEATVLDLFAGSGALGLESLSRGAKKTILCDSSKDAIHIIEKNVDKLNEKSNVQILSVDYLTALERLKKENQKVDIVFLDPPYKTEFIKKSCEKIAEYKLLTEKGIIIIETDRTNEIVLEIENINKYDIYDQRKYGRATLIFLREK